MIWHMSEPYPADSLLDTYRIDLRGLEDSIEYWNRPGAMAGAVLMGPEIRDGTKQHIEDLQQAAQRLRDLIARIEAKQND